MFGEPTNEDRAGWAMAAVDTFAERTGLNGADEELETKVGDLLGNLMHLCTINNVDFEQVLETGRMHFEAELVDEAKAAPRFITGNWNHIFADSKTERDLRFVFDTSTQRVVAMQILTGSGYENATRDAIADLQDSLLTANEEVLQAPEVNGLSATSDLPDWLPADVQKELLASSTPPLTQLKWFAVSGRIPGDDEDTSHIFQVANRQEAVAAFDEVMWANENESDRESVRKEHGQSVFINSVVVSSTKIEED